jgi:NADP-dependent aldehyde dehydrogenase
MARVPTVVLLERGGAGDAFAERLVELTRDTAAGTMLTAGIADAYRRGHERLSAGGASSLAEGAAGAAPASGQAHVFQVDAQGALANPRLLEEVFGPSTLLVRYRDAQELELLLRSLDGQLTTTVHAEPAELAAHAPLLRLLADKSGRVVVNQFPTGVEVGHAMVHGGPFPATTDPGSTSVGTRAITRFTRLVAYQNVPQECLPSELQDANPLAIRRLINGEPSSGPA